ncbi:MAG: flagellar hook-basal body complex protein [Planctomycetes bacterium]|nr:flagellar hook-basal body complex protein [Planctomycetota bacterium]MBI3835298.1 flagellar hook-basal body complex protein [Planctomycetota bacterium]
MSLTGAMMTGFTGIKSNGMSVDVVGDDLANLNTTAFKGQRVDFETLLYDTIRTGEGPSSTSGGTLPEQIGTGAGVADIQRDFRQGGFDSTGLQSDLALEGDGFFIVNGPNNTQEYTRDGAFNLDASQTLVDNNGNAVQVFLPDATGAIVPGTLGNLVIPLGTQNQAIPTTQVTMDGNLDPSADVAATGAVAVSQPMLIAGGAAATATTALTSLVDANGAPLFATGDQLAINGTKGGVAIPEQSFVVGTDGTTVGDLTQYMQNVFGIDPTATTGATPSTTPGVTIAAGPQPPAGSMVINSNVGDINAVSLDSASIVNKTGLITSPFAFTITTPATGQGVTTTFNVYDSLGNPVDVRLRAVLQSKSDTGTTWQYYAESYGDSRLSPALGTGTITFDTNGQFVSATGNNLTIDRTGIGAGTPITLALDLSGLSGLASTQGGSQLIMADQNGAPPGTLTNYGIDRDGIVTGTYSNQQKQTLGQIAVATFTNDQGLVAQPGNLYLEGPNSGAATVGAPQTGRAGAVVAGALEQSNVEIAREFVTLISAQTAISASSRVVRTADDILQQLLTLTR